MLTNDESQIVLLAILVSTITGGVTLRVFGHFIAAPTVALVVVEWLLMWSACYFVIASGGVSSPTFPTSMGPVQASMLFSAFAMMSMVATGLYNHDVVLSYRSIVLRIIFSFILLLPIFVIIDLVLQQNKEYDFSLNLLLYAKAVLVWSSCLIASRIAFMQLTRTNTLKRRVVVIGSGSLANKIRDLGFPQQLSSQFIPVAFVGVAPDNSGFLYDSSKSELQDVVHKYRAAEILVATDDRRGLPTHELLRCKVSGIKVSEYHSFCERELGRVDLDAMHPSRLIFSDGFCTGPLVRAAKRVFDVIAAIAVLILTLPILLMTAALIPLDSEGPILYRQERVGQHGKNFTLFKFRSMRVNAEDAGIARWAAQDDPRTTRLGAWIRKVRIDELPQLLNVLRGEMSFIGPRPERPQFVNELSKTIPFYDERHALKPGITGWAQINYPYGASIEDAKRKLEYDLYYVKNYTLFLDFAILISTLRVILFPDGAR